MEVKAWRVVFIGCLIFPINHSFRIVWICRRALSISAPTVPYLVFGFPVCGFLPPFVLRRTAIFCYPNLWGSSLLYFSQLRCYWATISDDWIFGLLLFFQLGQHGFSCSSGTALNLSQFLLISCCWFWCCSLWWTLPVVDGGVGRRPPWNIGFPWISWWSTHSNRYWKTLT
jgi:hypothetical protein